MIEFLLNWFGANYPQLVGILVLAIVFIAIGMFISNVRNRFKKVENTLDELECSSHAEDIRQKDIPEGDGGQGRENHARQLLPSCSGFQERAGKRHRNQP